MIFDGILYKQKITKMITFCRSGYILYGVLLIGVVSFAKANTKHTQTKLKKEVTMDTTQNNVNRQVYFIDKFLVPKGSIEEFTQRMNYNRNFIKNLPGFINDQVYEKTDEDGNITIITIATWKDQESVDIARDVVQSEYKRTGFNPVEFYKRLNIKMERGIYHQMKDK